MALKKASAQYRSEIAALKKRLTALEVQIKRIGKASAKISEKSASENDSPSLRFKVGGFTALREKLDLSVAEMGKLIGISAQSIPLGNR